MASCDMCGKSTELVNARVEGAEMSLCAGCSKFGVILNMPRSGRRANSNNTFSQKSYSPPPQRSEIIQTIVSDYAEKIRKAREKLGINQEAFAKKLSEKQSIMQKIEAGQFKPSITTARKLEKLLKINLVEQIEDGKIPLGDERKRSSEGMTIADFIKKR